MFDNGNSGDFMRHAVTPFGTPGFEGVGAVPEMLKTEPTAPTTELANVAQDAESLTPESANATIDKPSKAAPRKLSADAVAYQKAANINGILLAGVGAAVGSYHGYRRYGNSVGWGALWGVGGLVFPVIAVAVALGQGVGKRK